MATAVCLTLAACAPSGGPVEGTGSGADISGTAEPDTVAPRLLGVQDLTVAQNGTAYYREGVSAEDDVDGPVPVQIDVAAVDLTTPGEYPVIYSAQDAAGNRTEQTAMLTVVETETVDQGADEQTEDVNPAPNGGGGGGGGIPLDQVTQEDVYRLADQILGKITNSGMSQRDKAKAIYNYVSKHIKYVGSSDKSSWVIGAYVGFTRGKGDCYNYYACSKVLLDRAGISNVDLQRVGGTSRHYWQLVNVGDGWYHFDSCWKPTHYPLYACLISETQVRDYTKKLMDAGVRQNYYVYDYAACPVRAVGFPAEGVQPAENPGTEQQPVVNPEQPGTDPAVEPQPGEPPAGGENPGTEEPSAGEEEPVDTTYPPDYNWEADSGGLADPTDPPPEQNGEGEQLAA